MRNGHLLRRMIKTSVYFVLDWSRWTLVLFHAVSFCRVTVIDIEQQLLEVRPHRRVKLLPFRQIRVDELRGAVDRFEGAVGGVEGGVTERLH